MKLLFFSEYYDDYAGGAEICLKTFLSFFINDGHFCILVTKGQERKKIAQKNSWENKVNVMLQTFVNNGLEFQ